MKRMYWTQTLNDNLRILRLWHQPTNVVALSGPFKRGRAVALDTQDKVKGTRTLLQAPEDPGLRRGRAGCTMETAPALCAVGRHRMRGRQPFPSSHGRRVTPCQRAVRATGPGAGLASPHSQPEPQAPPATPPRTCCGTSALPPAMQRDASPEGAPTAQGIPSPKGPQRLLQALLHLTIFTLSPRGRAPQG